MKYRSIIIVLLFAWSGLSAAQFRVTCWPAPVGELFYSYESEMVPLRIQPGSASKYYSLDAEKDLILYRRNESPSPDAPPYVAVAELPQAKLPENSALVVVIPVEDNRFRMMAIDDNEEDYPAGSLVISSLVPYKIAVKVEDAFYTLTALESLVTEPLIKNANARIQIGGYRNVDRRVKFNTNVLMRGGFRYFMFIQDTAVTQVEGRVEDLGMEVFFIRDYLRPISRFQGE